MSDQHLERAVYSILSKSSFFLAILGIVIGLSLLRVPNRKATAKALVIGCFILALASCEYNRIAADRKEQQEAELHGYKDMGEWKAAQQQLALIKRQLESIGERKAAEERERLRQEQKKEEEARNLRNEQQCAIELKCSGDKLLSFATTHCPRYIERLAKNDFLWTDGWLDSKFSEYRWVDNSHRAITFIGDKIKYQNGFGAWTFHIYECDVDLDRKSVTDVRAHPGRLEP
ncbi:hypothetical protein RAD15_42740 [Bradyrhizobium sp. 14AA]